jgi:hypothetical protein
MKKIFSALLVVAMLFIANVNIQAQNNLIRNTEEKDGVIVTETVYKLDGGTLTNYMKHNYKYDENKQRTEDEALKWNGVRDEWEKDLCIRYSYTEKTITTSYYKWNKKKKDYVIVPEMTITLDR